MSNLLSRILLAIIMFPLATILYLIVFLPAGRAVSDAMAFLLASVVVAGFVVLYWLGLWHKSVRWTSARVTTTFFSGLGCLIVGTIIGVLVAVTPRPVANEDLAIFLAGLTTIVLWLAVSVLVWRETAAERAERIQASGGDVLFCPKCGYNMTGLYEARCPECGSRFTLDQLLANQRQQAMEVSDGTGERLTE